MSDEELAREQQKPEHGSTSSIHEEEHSHNEVDHHDQESEDEHFEEAQSEKPKENEVTKEEDKLEEGEEYVVESDEEIHEAVEEPIVAQEKPVKERTEEEINYNTSSPLPQEEGTEHLDNRENYNEYENGTESGSRVVSNAIHSMSSQAKDGYGAVISELAALTMRGNDKKVAQPKTFQSAPAPTQASLYQQNQDNRMEAMSDWQRSPERPTVYAAPPPPPAYEQPRQQVHAVTGTTVNITNVAPAPKFTSTAPYIGSHVIASETGPSLTILLRRPTSERQWGFSFYGGAEFGCPPFVNRVTKNGLAYQQGMEVGDVIVSICRTLTVGKTHEQLKAEILRAGNDLDLVLIRSRGVDLEKLAQIVPQVFQSTAKSPPSSVTYGSSEYIQTESSRTRSSQSLTRGRSFRSVKTKSIRILEEQLASGQNPSSVVATKQHFQGARGLPSNGAVSTYTTAYGQNRNQGYAGRQVIIQPSTTGYVSVSPSYPSPYTQQYSMQPSYQSYATPSYADGNVVRSQTTWETRSDFGTGGASSSGWSAAASPYGQQTYYSPSQISPSYGRGGQHNATASITVPMHGRQQWQPQYM